MIEELGAAQFPDVYTALAIAWGGGLLVYRKQSPAFDNAVRALRLDAHLRFRDALFPAAELRAVVERIIDDLPVVQRGTALVATTAVVALGASAVGGLGERGLVVGVG